MPALHLFHRRTLFAGDDLQPTAILTSFAHLSQFLLLLLPVFIHMIYEARYMLQPNDDNGQQMNGDDTMSNILHYFFGNGNIFYDNEECNARAHFFPLLLNVYFLFSTIHIILSLFFEYIIYKLSSIGSPTEKELRNPLLGTIVENKWIWLNILGNVAVLSLGFGALSQSNLYFNCRDVVSEQRGNIDDQIMEYGDLMSIWFGKRAWWVALILLQASQSVELLVSAWALQALLRKERVITGMNDAHSEEMDFDHEYEMHHERHELVEEMWTQRCRAFCKCAASSTCYLFGGKDLVDGVVGDYGQVSRALADYFEDGGVLDVVVSDIAAGFMMLQRRQRQRVLAARKRINDDIKSRRDQQQHRPHDEQDEPASFLVREDSSHSHSTNMSNGSCATPRKSISRSSSMTLDTHNFGNEQDKRMQSMISPNGLDHQDLYAELSNIPHYQNQALQPSQHSMFDDETALMSILQPMPYTRTLLLPDGPLSNTNPATDFLNIPTAAWTLKKTKSGDDNEEGKYQPQQRKVFNRNDTIDTNIIAEGARFARHSLSIYTWVLYVYMKPMCGPSRLVYNRLAHFCKQCRGNQSSRNTYTNPDNNLVSTGSGDSSNHEENNLFCNIAHGNTLGDNCCHANRNGLLAHSGIDESDLIFANFNNKYNQMPYCIVVDHKWQSVVLAIRGTLSLEDCLVDVLVDPEPLDDLGREYNFDASGQFCHSGVLSCVKYILNDLKRHDILNSLLTGVGAPYAHYTLRITGHSLGGGCATLLGYVLRQQFPTLRVIAISPPGGLMTWKLATECKDFITSFVLDSDLVPRLSVETMETLRDEVLEMISRIKVPKVQVLKTFILNGILRSYKETNDPEKLAHDNAQILHNKENIPTDTEFHQQMEKFRSIQKERKERRGDYRNISMFPPGKMIHLVKIDERRSFLHSIAKCLTCGTSNVGYKYTPVYVNNDDFDEITITPTMFPDHFPNRVCVELERVAEAFGIDTSLGSSERDYESAERVRNDNSLLF